MLSQNLGNSIYMFGLIASSFVLSQVKGWIEAEGASEGEEDAPPEPELRAPRCVKPDLFLVKEAEDLGLHFICQRRTSIELHDSFSTL